MREANFTVSSMHGDMVQKEREAIMKEFRSGARYFILCKLMLCSAFVFTLLTNKKCEWIKITKLLWQKYCIIIHETQTVEKWYFYDIK